ncbi:hypothetical protein J6590_021428 [Homalodisca vitripennis]|nr:hypothetical protein J6590_021428 [Homalodisca vitripennis]
MEQLAKFKRFQHTLQSPQFRNQDGDSECSGMFSYLPKPEAYFYGFKPASHLGDTMISQGTNDEAREVHDHSQRVKLNTNMWASEISKTFLTAMFQLLETTTRSGISDRYFPDPRSRSRSSTLSDVRSLTKKEKHPLRYYPNSNSDHRSTFLLSIVKYVALIHTHARCSYPVKLVALIHSLASCSYPQSSMLLLFTVKHVALLKEKNDGEIWSTFPAPPEITQSFLTCQSSKPLHGDFTILDCKTLSCLNDYKTCCQNTFFRSDPLFPDLMRASMVSNLSEREVQKPVAHMAQHTHLLTLTLIHWYSTSHCGTLTGLPLPESELRHSDVTDLSPAPAVPGPLLQSYAWITLDNTIRLRMH